MVIPIGCTRLFIPNRCWVKNPQKPCGFFAGLYEAFMRETIALLLLFDESIDFVYPLSQKLFLAVCHAKTGQNNTPHMRLVFCACVSFLAVDWRELGRHVQADRNPGNREQDVARHK